MKAILTLAFSEFKQLLDKNFCNFQTWQMKKQHKPQNVAYFFSLCISLFTKSIEGRELCLLLILWVTIFESQLGGGQDSLTFWVGNSTLGTVQLKVRKSEIPTSKYKWNAAYFPDHANYKKGMTPVDSSWNWSSILIFQQGTKRKLQVLS